MTPEFYSRFNIRGKSIFEHAWGYQFGNLTAEGTIIFAVDVYASLLCALFTLWVPASLQGQPLAMQWVITAVFVVMVFCVFLPATLRIINGRYYGHYTEDGGDEE